MRGLAIFAVLFASSTVLQAQDQLTPLVSQGLDALRAGQCEAAFGLWTEQWAEPEDLPERTQILGGCAFLAKLGTMHGFEVLRIVSVSPSIRRTYAILQYEKRPVYFMMVIYRPALTWKVLALNWNTDYDKVVPASLFGEERPHP